MMAWWLRLLADLPRSFAGLPALTQAVSYTTFSARLIQIASLEFSLVIELRCLADMLLDAAFSLGPEAARDLQRLVSTR